MKRTPTIDRVVKECVEFARVFINGRETVDNIKLEYYTWDLETFPNCFLFGGRFRGATEFQVFEISDRVNQRTELLSWLSYLQNRGSHLVGYNNIGFDYPIIHELLNNPYTFDATKAHELGTSIIMADSYGATNIRYQDRIIPQIDLSKINHFDNKMRRTSLKALEFAMRADSVEDLPFPVRPLTFEEMDKLRSYHLNDIKETERFLERCEHLIELRKELLETGVLTGDVLNYSDVKIGEKYLVSKIGYAKCYNGGKPKQTYRSSVAFKEVLLPKIFFRTPEFQRVHDWFNQTIVHLGAETKPEFEARLGGLDFFFGLGGVHASVDREYFETTEEFEIIDVDVAGMYVAVGVVNGFYPEHLGQEFVKAYRQLQKDRALHKKGTAMNAVLKLAGNGVYGKSNDVWSCFHDPKYTFTVTGNGQLQLLQLAEVFSLIPGLKLIQANTDGITAYVPKKMRYLFDFWKGDWERETGYKLEEVVYKKMWIRDVNNYVAVKTDNTVKRKGAYWFPESWKDYDGVWNKDFSALVVQKAADLVLRLNVKPEDAVYCSSNKFDFMLRHKVTAGATVKIGEKVQQKTIRYYVSTKGEKMVRISKPKGKIGEFKRKNGLKDSEFYKIAREVPEGVWDERIHTKNKSTYEIEEKSIEAGWLVKECNKAVDFDWKDVDWRYYAQEVAKLDITRGA
jgi:hypothetical protein